MCNSSTFGGAAFDIAFSITITQLCMKIISKKSESGVTIIELMVGVSITVVLLAVVALFTTGVFDISRQGIEQGRINETARVQMERMSDAIRTASNVDSSGNKEYDGGAERWIQTAAEDEIEVWADVDGNGVMKLIIYSLSGSNLQLDGETVAIGVQNMVLPSPIPMFKYYSVGGTNAVQVDPAVVGLDAIGQVEITLVVDADVGQAPEAGVFSTVVTPRRGYLVLNYE